MHIKVEGILSLSHVKSTSRGANETASRTSITNITALEEPICQRNDCGYGETTAGQMDLPCPGPLTGRAPRRRHRRRYSPGSGSRCRRASGCCRGSIRGASPTVCCRRVLTADWARGCYVYKETKSDRPNVTVNILLTCSVAEIQMTRVPALELICASLLDARTGGSGIGRAANAGVVRAKLVEVINETVF
jgi:hypothetical protein